MSITLTLQLSNRLQVCIAINTAGIPPGLDHAARRTSVTGEGRETEHEMPITDDENDWEEADEESNRYRATRIDQDVMPARAKFPTEHEITTGEPTEVAVSMQLTQAVNSILLQRIWDENIYPDENEIADDAMRPRHSRVRRRRYTSGRDFLAIR